MSLCTSHRQPYLGQRRMPTKPSTKCKGSTWKQLVSQDACGSRSRSNTSYRSILHTSCPWHNSSPQEQCQDRPLSTKMTRYYPDFIRSDSRWWSGFSTDPSISLLYRRCVNSKLALTPTSESRQQYHLDVSQYYNLKLPNFSILNFFLPPLWYRISFGFQGIYSPAIF